jgi:hypothetical protein
MGIIRTHRKGKRLNTLEKYHINKISKDNLKMNDTDTDTHNPSIQSTTGNEHQLAALNMPCIVDINTVNVTVTPTTSDSDGRPPGRKLPLLQKHSGQPHPEPKEIQQTSETVSNIRYADIGCT